MKKCSLVYFVMALFMFFNGNILGQSADITKACAPIKIKFTAPAGFSSWFWDFKDGGSSNLENPEHIFTNPGMYIVEFKENISGTLIGSVKINILPKPNVNVSAEPVSGCVPLDVTITDLTQYSPEMKILSKNWTYGDGGFGSGDKVSHKYLKPGLKDLALEVKTDLPGCDFTQIFKDKINVFPLPLAIIKTDPDPAASCEVPFTVSFSDNSVGNKPFSYDWNFGNGNTSANALPPQQTYTSAGNYHVTLHLTDINGCSHDTFYNVLVGIPKLDVKFPDSVCTNFGFSFENKSSAGNHKWDLGPGAVPAISNLRSPSVKFTSPGIHQVHYTLSTNGGKCVLDTVFNIFVYNIADVLKVDYDMDDCSSPVEIQLDYNGDISSIDYIFWKFGKFATSNEVNPLFKYKEDKFDFSIYGQRNVLVMFHLESKACNADTSFNLPIDLLTACYTAESYNGCIPFDVKMKNCSYSKQPIVKWTWDFGDGTVIVKTDSIPPSHTYVDCGNFYPTLIVENSVGCIDTSYAIKFKVCGCVPPPPMVTCNNKDSVVICHGDKVYFKVIADKFWVDIRVESDGHRLFHCSQDREFSWVFNHEPGYHDILVSGISINGDYFQYVIPKAIHVLGPWAQGSYMATDCSFPKTFMFTDKSQNATSIKWIFPDGQISTLKNPTHLFLNNGHQKVLLVAYNDIDGCPNDTTSFLIYTGITAPKIEMPVDTFCAGKILFEMSGDAYLSCYNGIKWTFDHDTTPITTSMSVSNKYFNDPGKFTTTLETYDENGCKYTSSKSFVIHTVKADFSGLPEKICLPYSMHLKDNSAVNTDPIVSYKWTINGDTLSTQKDFNFELTDKYLPVNDTIIISLSVVTSLGCDSYIKKFIRIYKPTSKIHISGKLVYCQNEAIDFSADDYNAGGSFLDYSWDFGNGLFSNKMITQTSYKNPGNYIVSLIYTEHTTGCTDTLYQPLSIQDKPNADFVTSVDSESVLCYPKNIYFDNIHPGSGGWTYAWDFGNGQVSNFKNAGTVYDKGNYTATVIVTSSAGCTDTSSHSFVLIGPEGNFSFDKTAICKGDQITLSLSDTAEVGSWVWDFGDGVVVNGINPITHTYTYLPPGDSTVAKIIFTDFSNKCSYTAEKVIPITNVIADFEIEGGAQTICPGALLELINKSQKADIYFWKFSDGATSTLSSPKIKFTQEGQFTITLIATNSLAGCKDSITKTFQVKNLEITGLANPTICPGDTVLIGLNTPVDSATYLWSPTTNLLNQGNYQALVFPKATTDYKLTVTKPGGCVASATVKVNVETPYSGQLSFQELVTKGTQVTLKLPLADSLYKFQWEPSALLSCSKCPNPVYVADTTALFNLVLTDINGCGSYNITYLIKVVPDKILIPDVFTPNGDNKNDFFQIFAPGGSLADIGIITFEVYSRWGQKVYDNSDVTKGWDGKFRGKDCPSDVYVYVIYVKYFNGKEQGYRGEITLVR